MPRAALAEDALQAYEILRQAVMQHRPCRPAGMAALRFHGMWHGLGILKDAPEVAAPRQSTPHVDLLAPDQQFVRLVANLVLRTHKELTHVY